MSYEEENVRKVLAEYDTLRAKAQIRRDKLVEKIYNDFPRLEEIKDEINRLGFENTKRIMGNPEKSKEFNEEFNKKLAELIEERDRIIKENNISPDFNKPVYSCELCNDTGYIENEKCSCFKQKLIEKAYSQSNLGNLLYDQDFDKFSLDYYSGRVSQGETVSDRENMKFILRECLDFCESFDKPFKNLLMIGKPGLGKTFLSNCIAKRILDSGKNVIYTRATSLFSSYEDYRFGRSSEFNRDRLYNSDLLIIDDLGTENITKSGISFFFDLINERIDKNKKIIINSNLTMPEISKVYSTRITSRMYEHFSIMHFRGEDIRIQKLK